MHFSLLSFFAECGGTFTDPTGDVFSPNYPNYYSSSMTCYYFIHAPDYYIIQLTLHDFQLQYYYDKLTVSKETPARGLVDAKRY